MAKETKVNVQKLKDVGTAIGYIVDENKAHITDLGKIDPNAGKFDAAVWLKDLFVDRRDAATTHVKYLESAYKELNEGLVAIAKEFEGVDSTNADAVAKFNAKAKGIIGEMGKSEYAPVMSKGKTSYETGDDDLTGDKDTFDFKDPKKPTILEFDPKDVPGMKDLMTKDGLGADDKGKIDFNEQGDIKGDKPITVDAGPPTAPGTEGTPPPVPAPPVAPPPANKGLGGEPKEGWPGEKSDKDFDGKSFRYYNVEGKHQSVNGKEVWWANGESYIQTGSSKQYFMHYTGDTSTVSEPKNNAGYPGESHDKDWGGNSFRYYDVNGKHQTHNGNEIWWTNGQPYVKMPTGAFVKYEI